MNASSPNQIDRLQTGRFAQLDSWLNAAAQRPVNVCKAVAVRADAPHLARTAIASAEPSYAPRQRPQPAPPARCIGKMIYARILVSASAGKTLHRTGGRA